MIDLFETVYRPVMWVAVVCLYSGEGLLRERAEPSPLSALFGYFLREQKVAQGCGAAQPREVSVRLCLTQGCGVSPREYSRGFPAGWVRGLPR